MMACAITLRFVLRLALLASLLMPAWVAQAENPAWPVVAAPPDVPLSSAGASISLGGLPMRIHVFATDKSTDDILDFYREQWGTRRVENKVKGATVIGRKEGDYFTTVQVTSSAGLTKGVVAITRLTAPASAPSYDPFQAPFNSKVLSDMQSVDGGKISRQTIFTNTQSTTTNRDRLVAMMEAEGMKLEVEGAPDAQRGQALFFRGGGQEAIAAITRNGAESAVVLSVTSVLKVRE